MIDPAGTIDRAIAPALGRIQKLALALALAACAPPPRPPVPDVAGQLDREVLRVDRLAWRAEADQRIREAENAFLLARTKRERERAGRALLWARRGP